MIKLDSLSSEARDLINGTRCIVKRAIPRTPPPAGSVLQSSVGCSCLLSSPLRFTTPVGITSISLIIDKHSFQPDVFLAYDNMECVVALARDVSGRHQHAQKSFTFLSPLGFGSRDDYVLYVSQARAPSSSADESFQFERLELAYFALETTFAPLSDADVVDFQVDGQMLQANKFMLSASSAVFRAQLFGQCADADCGVIQIDEFSYSSFSFFLSLLADTSADNAYRVIHCAPQDVDLVEVFALADKYCAGAARLIAEAAVLQRVSESGVRELLEQCRRFKATSLAQRICEQVVARSPKEAVAALLSEVVTKSMDAR